MVGHAARLGPRGGRDGLTCADGDDNPHWATRASDPPRCERHYAKWERHLGANRTRKNRSQPEQEWDPGKSTPAEQDFLLLDHADVSALLDLVDALIPARLALKDADTEKAYRRAASNLDGIGLEVQQYAARIGASKRFNEHVPPTSS